MIVAITTAPHRYTLKRLKRSRAFRFRVISYDRAFRSASLPRATYVFTDFDRLNSWELELASHLFREIIGQGGSALNDPARVRQRYSLLKTLNQRGLNDFNAWRVEESPQVNRFPVFLRMESGHLGTVSDLLHSQEEVDAAIDQALSQGYPRRELIVVEYCAQPISNGLFRKYSIYRVGQRMVPSLSVHDSEWIAKSGKNGVAGAQAYQEEYEMVHSNCFSEQLKPYFEAAEIDFGRADFGMVNGKPQVYEINTNPAINVLRKHPYPIRLQAFQEVHSALQKALAAVDTPSGPRFVIKNPLLAAQRRYDRWMTGARWIR
jgi:hypothetical protein